MCTQALPVASCWLWCSRGETLEQMGECLGRTAAVALEIRREMPPDVAQISWAAGYCPTVGFRGTPGPQLPTATALAVVAVFGPEW
jgi:hypothetical protein